MRPLARTAPATDVAPGLRLGRLFGVELRLDWSLLLIFTLITVNLGAGVFPRWHPEWSAPVVWLTALLAAVLFFASVMVHELSHAVVARLTGVPVSSITLFLFGGVARMKGEPRSAGAEFLIAAVGPLTSLVIGVVSIVAALLLIPGRVSELDADQMELVMRSAGPLPTLLAWLGPVNVVLAIFNMLPGFPLDGGRVLRSIFWAVTHDFAKATRWAAYSGQVFAGLLFAFGALQMLGGAVGNGVWLMLIAWFLGSAARNSLMHVMVRRALADVTVARVMRTRLETVEPALPLDAFVRDHLLRGDQHAWPAVRDARLEGLITWDDVRSVPQEMWPQTAVLAAMTPRANLITIGSERSAEAALELMNEHGVEQLPVLADEQLVGLVLRSDLLRWFQLQQQGGPRRPLTPLRH